ncbi:MAG: hypothetical protein K0S41_3043 [Anaerocolumna sp.]|jgi:germination protein M|nr:hypothetical protein [Anaerocolumna sp.]
MKGFKGIILTLLLFMMILLGACNQNDSDKDKNNTNKDATYIYYINKSETKLVDEIYNPKGTTKSELVEEYLNLLTEEPKDYAYKKTIPDSVLIDEYKFNKDDRLLSIYFDSGYSTLTGISEVLCRASIVKTLTQIEGVDSVEFYVDGQPLKGANDKPIGFMDSDEFITGNEDVFVTVYFSNETGTALVPSNLKITYDGNASIEKLIIEQLVHGPIEENMIKTLPEGTELIKVSTKDGICYVDFNEKFLEKVSGIKDEVVLYSVVNSLDELSTINKVQFTINGSPKKNFRDKIPFDSQFERNLELVEGSK